MLAQKQSNQSSSDCMENSEHLHFDEKCKKENQIEQKKEPSKNFCLNHKFKIIFAVIALLAISGIGLGVGLYFRFKVTLEPVGPKTVVDVGNGTYYGMQQFELKESDLFGNQTVINITLSQAIHFDGQTNRRLLQQDSSNPPQTSDFSAHANINQVGVQLSMSSNSDLAIRLNLDSLLDHMEKTDPEISRLLTQGDISGTDNPTLSQAEVLAEVQKALSEVLSDQVVNPSSLQFKPAPVINFAFNNQTKSFEETNGTQTTNQTRRMLIVRQLRFWRRIFRGFRKIFRVIVRPVVSVIRKHAPMIGTIAGGIIGGVGGFMAGGPAGAIAGAKAGASLGAKVGIAAQALVTACVPTDRLTIRCEKEGVLNAVGGVLAETTTTGITSQFGSSALRACGSTCDNTIKAMTQLIK